MGGLAILKATCSFFPGIQWLGPTQNHQRALGWGIIHMMKNKPQFFLQQLIVGVLLAGRSGPNKSLKKGRAHFLAHWLRRGMASRAPVPSQTSDHKCLVCKKSEGSKMKQVLKYLDQSCLLMPKHPHKLYLWAFQRLSSLDCEVLRPEARKCPNMSEQNFVSWLCNMFIYVRWMNRFSSSAMKLNWMDPFQPSQMQARSFTQRCLKGLSTRCCEERCRDLAEKAYFWFSQRILLMSALICARRFLVLK